MADCLVSSFQSSFPPLFFFFVIFNKFGHFFLLLMCLKWGGGNVTSQPLGHVKYRTLSDWINLTDPLSPPSPFLSLFFWQQQFLCMNPIGQWLGSAVHIVPWESAWSTGRKRIFHANSSARFIWQLDLPLFRSALRGRLQRSVNWWTETCFVTDIRITPFLLKQ